MSDTQNQPPLVWIDLEMTGLDPDSEDIIEIATVITDADLQIIAEGPDLIIHLEPERFAKMDEWNRDHHSNSGLWQQVVKSKLTLADAESQTLDFIQQHTEPGLSPLCGNSIWQDRRFLCKHMPKIHEHLHYRLVDVSTIKELSKRWYADQEEFPGKKGTHRAMDDIKESIEELKYYRNLIFRQPGE